MAILNVGDNAPAFSLSNQFGKSVALEDFKGKSVVLYFYPKALTPGCTVQACGMRDIKEDLASSNAIILAISPDPSQKLAKFAEKHSLNFDLLADEDHQVCEKYGVWQLKKFMGKEFMGVVRSTFIISPAGKIQHATDSVKTKTHQQDVLKLF